MGLATITVRGIVFVGLLIGLPRIAASAQPTTSPSLPRVRIALVGDSTVARNTGWGEGFTACLLADAKITNLARPGRSSMSFIAQGFWQKCIDLKPDYVLIQFGHNDQRLEDPTRGTDPKTTYRKYMNQYVDEARAAGIKPVLITSLSRRQWGPDGKIHSTLQPYVDVAKDISRQKHVPLIDLHAISITLYEKIGREQVNLLSPLKPTTEPANSTSPVIDPTHLNAKGGVVIGRIVAEQLAGTIDELRPYVSLSE